MPFPPDTYLNHSPNIVIDGELSSFICNIAERWAILLDSLGEEYATRATRLSKAAHNRHQGKRRLQVRNYRHLLGRLMQVDPTAAGKIEKVERYWSSPFDHQRDYPALLAFTQDIEKDDSRLTVEDKNESSLLELTVAVSIARAAVSAPPEDRIRPQVQWEVSNEYESNKRTYGDIELKAGQLFCSITKRAPTSTDRINYIRQTFGHRPRGSQPDLTIEFWLAKDPAQKVIIFGDAKRNFTDDGKAYAASAIESGCIYLLSYGQSVGGLRLVNDPKRIFTGAINPAMTLFFLQGADKVAGINSKDHLALIEAFRNNAEEMPPIIGLDMTHISDIHENGEWSAPVLSAWFGRVSKQAYRYLTSRKLSV